MARTFVELGLITMALALLAFPFFVQAETTVINNSTSASASTGGNNASSGQVVEGTSSASASSQTWVNGELVENEYEEDTDDDGDAHAELETEWVDGETGTTIKNSASVSTGSGASVYATPEDMVETGAEMQGSSTAATGSEVSGSNDYQEADNSSTPEPQNLWERIISYVFSLFSF